MGESEMYLIGALTERIAQQDEVIAVHRVMIRAILDALKGSDAGFRDNLIASLPALDDAARPSARAEIDRVLRLF